MMPNDKRGSLLSEALFDQIYASHRQSLHAYFLGRTGDGEVALDLLQEIFLRAWRNLASLQEKTSDQQRYWLFTVAKNLLTDYYRRQTVQINAQTALHNQTLQTLPAHKDPDTQIEVSEQLQQLDNAIQQLPENLRTVLLMQVLGDLNSTQSGDILDLPAGTVRYQLSMARKRLSEVLQRHEAGQIKKS